MSTVIGLVVYLGLVLWLYLLRGHGRFLVCLAAVSLGASYLTTQMAAGWRP